jgi:hypothetical protein
MQPIAIHKLFMPSIIRTFAFVIFFGAIVVLGFAAPSRDDWKKIENKSFSFSLPPSFKKTDAHGIDSYVEEYVADGIEVSFDYGIYSNNFEGWPKETKFESLVVDGRAAKIGTAAYGSQKGFPISTQIYIKLGDHLALSMSAACKSQEEVTTAKKIFKTIVFVPKTHSQLTSPRWRGYLLIVGDASLAQW